MVLDGDRRWSGRGSGNDKQDGIERLEDIMTRVFNRSLEDIHRTTDQKLARMNRFEAKVEEHDRKRQGHFSENSKNCRLTFWNAGVLPVVSPPAHPPVARQLKKSFL